jgi:DNA-directed RNA polymerase subunit RPC12/RpoP
MALYNIYFANHGKELIRVGHNECLMWYMSLDGKHWTPVDDHTLKSALNDAHRRLHRHGEECKQELEWKLVEATRAPVLGECPKCANPALDSDLKTYRRCPDCGWRIDFTKEQIEWVENMLQESREGLH